MPADDGNAATAIVIVIAVFIPVIFFVSVLGFFAAEDLNLQTAPDIKDEVEFSVTGNWSDNGVLSGNMQATSDYLYVGNNNEGNWTSRVFNVQRQRLVTVTYDADIRDGTGTLTIRAYNENVSDGVDAVRKIPLESGVYTEEFNLSRYEFYQYDVYLQDNQANTAEVPRFNSFESIYQVPDGEMIGVGDEYSRVVVFLLIAWFALMLIVLMFASMEE